MEDSQAVALVAVAGAVGDMDKKKILKDLQTIPGIGISLSRDLYDQGFRKVSDLNNQDPQKMYERQCELQGIKVDPCVLYTFRCAVYFASNKKHDPKLLKWWNWKDNSNNPINK